MLKIQIPYNTKNFARHAFAIQCSQYVSAVDVPNSRSTPQSSPPLTMLPRNHRRALPRQLRPSTASSLIFLSFVSLTVVCLFLFAVDYLKPRFFRFLPLKSVYFPQDHNLFAVTNVVVIRSGFKLSSVDIEKFVFSIRRKP